MLANALQRAGTRTVVDLCSGAAGPWLWLLPSLAEQGLDISVCLTDRYPNVEAWHRNGNPAIRCHQEPVDATQVPPGLRGFRTMFTAFHHFRPDQARAIVADAVRQGEGIAVVEVTQRGLLSMLLMLPAPLVVWAFTPFIRPFRWSRLVCTYLIPLVPLVTLFDGLVSCLRSYTVEDLRGIAASLAASGYHWEIGSVRGKGNPVPVTYLIGVPRSSKG